MSRTRLILLGLLAALAAGVVASASAEPPPPTSCMTVTSAPAYCVAGAPLTSGATEKFDATNVGEATLKATVSMVKTEIKCEAGKSKGTIEGGAAGAVGKSTMTDTFEKCKMITPANCKLTSAGEKEIKTTMLKGELVLTGGRVEDELEPKEGAFAAISIEGKESTCVIAEVGKPATYNVTGSQLCEIDSSNTEAEAEAATHKIICKDSGSSLKVGGKAEIASEATVKLISGKDWSVKET
jgi:hypothetical protein